MFPRRFWRVALGELRNHDGHTVRKFSDNAHVAVQWLSPFLAVKRLTGCCAFRGGKRCPEWIPGALASRAYVSLRASRKPLRLISSVIISAARSSTFLRSAGLSFRITSFTFTDTVTFLPTSKSIETPAGGNRPTIRIPQQLRARSQNVASCDVKLAIRCASCVRRRA